MPGPERERLISDVGALRAMSHPLRVRLLESLREPRAVKELAAELGTAPTKLYYHLDQLSEHGLVRVARTRLVSGIEERLYQVTARTFTVSADIAPDILGGSGTIGGVFDMTRREVEALVRARRGGADAGPPGVVSQTSAQMSAARFRSFVKRFEALVEEFEGDAPTGGRRGRGRRYGLLLALYPVPDERDEEE